MKIQKSSFVTIQEALSLLSVETSSKSVKGLLNDLKKINEYYYCQEKKSIKHGYFSNLNLALANPSEKVHFINIRQRFLEYIKVKKNNLTKHNQVKVNGDTPLYLLEMIHKNRHCSFDVGKYRLFPVETPIHEELPFDKCLILKRSVVHLHMKFPKVYRKPNSLKNLDDLLKEIQDSEGNDIQNKIDLHGDGFIRFGKAKFLVTQNQQKVMQNLAKFLTENKKEFANNYQIFQTFSYRGNQMSTVLTDINAKNIKGGLNIKDCILNCGPDEKGNARFKIDVPVYWL